MTVKLSKTQSALLAIVGARHLFVWGDFFCISDRDNGHEHGEYDRERELAARQARATIATVRQLINKGLLQKVTWFQADFSGRRAFIYRVVNPTIPS